MTEPITPKTTYPRSLKVSEVEQNRYLKEDINHNQLAQDFQKKSINNQNKVIYAEKSEGKKVAKEKDEGNSEGESSNGKEDNDEREEEKLELDDKGVYIDIKV
ncbi:hypothetical protein [Halonatronum saccharophilum]|uniref:hypothetical protein n=1 Tax=Halonatronum saccharophilum TaxID=150060 RepID=UPI00048733F3|nr:hypothetical protein [Halonatronum saccharophilum]